MFMFSFLPLLGEPHFPLLSPCYSPCCAEEPSDGDTASIYKTMTHTHGEQLLTSYAKELALFYLKEILQPKNNTLLL